MVKINEVVKKIKLLPGYKLFILLLAIGLLMIIGGKVIESVKQKETTTTAMETEIYNEQEKKIADTLSKIDGVGTAEVIITTIDKKTTVLVLTEAAEDPIVQMKIKQAVRTVLQTDNKNIKIIKKKS